MNEQRMSSVLIDFAYSLTADIPLPSILDRLVQAVPEVIAVTGAGVVLRGSDGRLNVGAASNESVRRIEELQVDLGEGPSLLSYATGDRVLIPDLSADAQFPGFSSRAAKAGLAGSYTFPLRMNGSWLGALDVYRTTTSPLDESDMRGAQTLADVAAAYLINATTRTELPVAEPSHRDAMHDALTGLPNRALLSDRLRHALRRSPRASGQIGLLFLDLDRFKAINDAFGHRAGDQVLNALGHRLEAVVRPSDTLSRLGGDEFVVLCEDLTSPAQIHEIAGRVLRAIAAPFTLDSGAVSVTGSVGVTITPKSAERVDSGDSHRTAEVLLRQAETAMYQAKQAGGARYVVTAATGVEASQRHVLERDLPQALRRNQLHLAYQPIADAYSGEWKSVEALLRWDHPLLGPIDAASIVSTAERGGLMPLVGRWVLNQACADLAAWRSVPGLVPDVFTVAVNVSPTELLDPGYATGVFAALAEHGIPAGSLCLELTESVLVEESPTTLSVLDGLKVLGVTLALDDFGTGYSTLTYLRRLPADVVKIDRSFLSGFDDPLAAQGYPDRAIVGSLIALSHALGLSVVAEGVESALQLERLRQLGCDLVQGHLATPPVLAPSIAEVLLRPPDWAVESVSLLPVAAGAAERVLTD